MVAHFKSKVVLIFSSFLFSYNIPLCKLQFWNNIIRFAAGVHFIFFHYYIYEYKEIALVLKFNIAFKVLGLSYKTILNKGHQIGWVMSLCKK